MVEETQQARMSEEKESDILSGIADLRTDKRERVALLRTLRRERLATDRSVKVVGQYIGSPDFNTASAALDVLGYVGSDESLSLIRTALNSQDSFVVCEALRNLRQSVGVAAIPDFLTCLETRGDDYKPSARRIILRQLRHLLRECPDLQAIQVLSHFSVDRNRGARAHAAASLRGIGTAESRSALESAERQLSWWRGRHARRALKSLSAISTDSAEPGRSS